MPPCFAFKQSKFPVEADSKEDIVIIIFLVSVNKFRHTVVEFLF